VTVGFHREQTIVTFRREASGSPSISRGERAGLGREKTRRLLKDRSSE
jgi:hypothetical protein